MRNRGLIGADGWLTADGRAVKTRIEALTDDLAAAAYDALQPRELAQLIADLEPIAAALNAAYDAETSRSRRNGVAAGLGGLTKMVLPSANRRNATEHPDLAGRGPRQRIARTCAYRRIAPSL